MVDAFANKALGQHWLRDDDVLEAMCDASSVSKDSYVLEIGPGLGTLTSKLLARGCTVQALEFDTELAKNLRRNVSEIMGEATSQLDRLLVTEGDIRTFNFETLPKDFVVCANIPYYLTSNLIRLLCDTPNQPSAVAILVQKEVAQRVVAEQGKMSVLSCVAQFYYDTFLGEVVPAKMFSPPPKVDSQILILRRRERPLFDVDRKQFFQLIKAGFGEKRKTLRNSLSGGLHVPKEEAERILESSGLDPMLRAETLTMEQWFDLFQNLTR